MEYMDQHEAQKTEHPIKDLFEDAPFVEQDKFLSSIPVIPQMALAFMLLIFVFGITYLGTENKIATKREGSKTTQALVGNYVGLLSAHISNTFGLKKSQ